MKLFIVDDEPNTRNGLKKFLEKQDIGLSEIRIAINGENALNMLKDYVPDVILCDVRMPLMDGIEFIGKVRELYPNNNIEVIYLSGFSDKEYLKAAIKYNVFDYIEKPVDVNQVKEIVASAVQKIKLSEYNNCMTALINAYFMNEFDDFLLKKILLSKKHNRFILIETFNANKDTNNSIFAYFKSENVVSIFNQVNNSTYIICVSSDEIEDIENDKINNLHECFKNNFSNPTILSTSDIQSDYICINNMIKQAKDRKKRVFFLGCSEVLFYDKVSCPQNLSNIIIEEYFKLLNIILETKKCKKLKTWINEIEKSFMSNEYPQDDIIDLLHRTQEILIIYCLTIGDNDVISNDIKKQHNKSQMLLSDYIDQIKIYINRIIEITILNNNAPIDLLTNYIDKNFNKQLTIKKLANEYSYSPNYISNMFREKLNISVHQYITKIRIDKAREMIVNSNKSFIEIGEYLGYKEYSHFSRVFKSVTGMSPKQYHQQN